MAVFPLLGPPQLSLVQVSYELPRSRRFIFAAYNFINSSITSQVSFELQETFHRHKGVSRFVYPTNFKKHLFLLYFIMQYQNCVTRPY